MTTYCFADNILAVDSLCICDNNRSNTNEFKLAVFEDAGDITVVVGTGEVLLIQAFIRWLQGELEEWPIPAGIETFAADVFILYADGQLHNCTFFDTPNPQINTLDVPLVRGSGAQLAAAFLHTGYGAIDAIRAVSEMNIHTGGDWIYYYDFTRAEMGRVPNNA